MLYPKCAYCSSIDMQPGLDTHQCLACGRLTRSDGTPVPPEPQFVVSQEDGPWRDNVEQEGNDQEVAYQDQASE